MTSPTPAPFEEWIQSTVEEATITYETSTLTDNSPLSHTIADSETGTTLQVKKLASGSHRVTHCRSPNTSCREQVIETFTYPNLGTALTAIIDRLTESPRLRDQTAQRWTYRGLFAAPHEESFFELLVDRLQNSTDTGTIHRIRPINADIELHLGYRAPTGETGTQQLGNVEPFLRGVPATDDEYVSDEQAYFCRGVPSLKRGTELLLQIATTDDFPENILDGKHTPHVTTDTPTQPETAAPSPRPVNCQETTPTVVAVSTAQQPKERLDPSTLTEDAFEWTSLSSTSEDDEENDEENDAHPYALSLPDDGPSPSQSEADVKPYSDAAAKQPR